LEKRTDADSLAAAGLLSLLEQPEAALALVTRAVAVEPDRADLVWLQVRSCQSQPKCDPAPLEARLRVLDPSNGVAWMGALVRAEAVHDEGAKDGALGAIGRSGRVDIYWTGLTARLSGAVAQTRVMSLRSAEVLVIGLLAAEVMPPYRIVSGSCRGAQAVDIEVCRGIARALESGDTYITEMVGVEIAKRVWPEGSPEWVAASEARRVYERRAKLFEAKIDGGSWDEKKARSYLMLCAANRREQDVFRASLVQAGEDPGSVGP
jgi:hypothetical protein